MSGVHEDGSENRHRETGELREGALLLKADEIRFNRATRVVEHPAMCSRPSRVAMLSDTFLQN